ncbi:hypothetical protein JJQ59_35230 (plasmid) [Cupriavidus necator]|uniref:Uncharacterized protein n=1 Tax=Cupriavidus necator TaxID=106590 RepID=A0A367PMS4_CUPNE|nr:hypothetical protein [Cupriavidus necator]QQX89769.1 hypothetical protein JJQ59_35230 [Cupriavidus necator]RCJ08356.1 hypothetical protein DDK22_11390 [Cupriavidus necator]
MVGSKMSVASPARSTPNGLIALLFHLSHAASQAQLDPGLVRELGKRIYTEIDACKTDDAQSQVELNLLSEAMARFEDTLLAARSHMLIAAIRRAGSTESPHPEGDQDPGPHEDGPPLPVNRPFDPSPVSGRYADCLVLLATLDQGGSPLG